MLGRCEQKSLPSHIRNALILRNMTLGTVSRRIFSSSRNPIAATSATAPLSAPRDHHPPHTVLLQRWAQSAWPQLSVLSTAIPRGFISTNVTHNASPYSFSHSPIDSADGRRSFPPGYQWHHRYVKHISMFLISLQFIGATVLLAINHLVFSANAPCCIDGIKAFNDFIASAAILHCAISLILWLCDVHEALATIVNAIDGHLRRDRFARWRRRCLAFPIRHGKCSFGGIPNVVDDRRRASVRQAEGKPPLHDLDR